MHFDLNNSTAALTVEGSYALFLIQSLILWHRLFNNVLQQTSEGTAGILHTIF